MSEGWTYLINSPKFHYFRDSVSLCRKWMYSGPDNHLQPEDGKPSKNDCKVCRRKMDLEAMDRNSKGAS